MAEYWVGADPGGKNKFGLAFLDASGNLSCTRVSSVDKAFGKIIEKGKLLGLGIDAPMWWSSREGGGRKADKLLRDTYGIHPGKVQSANSLRGAALVGGAMLACRIRQKFSDAKITESHPKAVLYALRLDRSDFPGKFEIHSNWPENEDEQDAAIAAVCAREGFQNAWLTDLADTRYRHKTEQDPGNYWLGPMHYFWPHDLGGKSD